MDAFRNDPIIHSDRVNKKWWLVIFGRNLGYRKHFQLPAFGANFCKYLWSSLPTSHATCRSPRGSRSLSVSSSQPIPFTACPWALCMRTIRRSNMHWIFAKRRRWREFLCNGGDWISRTKGHTTSTKGLVRKGPLPMQMQPQKLRFKGGEQFEWAKPLRYVEVIPTSFVVVWPSDFIGVFLPKSHQILEVETVSSIRTVGEFSTFFKTLQGGIFCETSLNFMTF